MNHAWTNLLIPEVRLGQFAKLVRGENTFKIPRTRTTPNSWDMSGESEDSDMKGVLPIAPHTLTDVFEIMLQIGNAAVKILRLNAG